MISLAPSVRSWPLRRKLWVLVVISSVLPLVLVSALVLRRERIVANERNVELLHARLDDVGHTIGATLGGYRGDAVRAAADHELAEYLGGSPSERRRLKPILTPHLVGIRGEDPMVWGVGVIDRDGDILEAIPAALVGRNVRHREYFQRALGGLDPFPDPFVSIAAPDRVPLLPFAVPVRSRSGAVVGVLAIWVRAELLWDVMRAANGLAGKESFYVLFDRYGIRIGHSLRPEMIFLPGAPIPQDQARAMLDEDRFGERTAELLRTVVPFDIRDQFRRGGRSPFRRRSLTTGRESLGIAHQLDELGWTLVALVPKSEVQVTLSSVLPQVAPGTLVGLAIALLGAVLLRRQVLRPIRNLADTVTALERGDFSGEAAVALDPVTADEIGELTVSFRRMARTLVKREDGIRESNRELRLVLDNVGQGFVTGDLEGRVVGERSAVVGSWFGEPAAGERIWSYLGRGDARVEEQLERGWRTLATGEVPPDAAIAQLPGRVERDGRTLELAYRLIENEGRFERLILVISDVTKALANQAHERKMEAELRQAQKLESVGRLAAGIAHEINTPVQFVNDNAHFLRDGIQDLQKLVEAYQRLVRDAAGAERASELERKMAAAEEEADLAYLAEHMPRSAARAIEGLERVAAIVRAMKEFAHPDTKQMSDVDLNEGIRSTLIIARNEYKYVADVETDLGLLPRVSCNAGEVNQVFLNIIVNAAHAIGDVIDGTGKKGLIRVSSRLEGDAVVVAIRDSGAGIPPAVQDRIFDPFFTTKPVGKGTGQGLWIARSVICEKHGGQLTFETGPGKGTTFFIRLPVEGRARSEGADRRDVPS